MGIPPGSRGGAGMFVRTEKEQRTFPLIIKELLPLFGKILQITRKKTKEVPIDYGAAPPAHQRNFKITKRRNKPNFLSFHRGLQPQLKYFFDSAEKDEGLPNLENILPEREKNKGPSR